MVSVVGRLCAANNVAPVHAHFVAGFDDDDLAGNGGLKAGFACEITVGYAVDCAVSGDDVLDGSDGTDLGCWMSRRERHWKGRSLVR